MGFAEHFGACKFLMFKFLVLQQPEVNGKEDVEVCSTKSLMDIFFCHAPWFKDVTNPETCW